MSCERYRSKRVEIMFGAMDQGKAAHLQQFKDDKAFLDYILTQERLTEKSRQYSYRAKRA